MRTFIRSIFLALGLVAVPIVSSAAPIGTNLCGLGETAGTCDIYADYEFDGASLLGALENNLGGYLVGYTFLLNQNADLSDGFQIGDVAHILVIHDSLFALFSNTVFDTFFGAIFDAATTGAAIDGAAVGSGQLAGCPAIPSGVPNLGGVGYCTTADEVALNVNWGFPDGSAGSDLLTIHTALGVVEPPPPTSDVPEPATMLLVGLGSASFLLRHRKAKV